MRKNVIFETNKVHIYRMDYPKVWTFSLETVRLFIQRRDNPVKYGTNGIIINTTFDNLRCTNNLFNNK